ncbi:MAG: Wzz/FepE/Etk N-terminal domain-containing protein, partial [Ginsengibacter sp.]
MTTQELTRIIYQRLRKFGIIIIIVGIVAALAMVFYAKQKPVTYTSRSSVFPLTSGNDNNATSSTLSALLGTETTKSFSDDASINIIELAQSRTTREEVASIRDSSMGNKTIAELLVDDINNHRGWFEDKVQMPPNQYALITWAGEVLRDGLNATVNKNNMLILSYT